MQLHDKRNTNKQQKSAQTSMICIYDSVIQLNDLFIFNLEDWNSTILTSFILAVTIQDVYLWDKIFW